MKKRSLIPETRVKNPEPKEKDENWIIWAAWADRITFEEIKEKTGNYLTSGSKNTSGKIKLQENPEVIVWGVVTYVIHQLH